MKRRLNGFTLVELAVSISVIGLLATIGAISYSNAQKNARDTARDSTVSVIVDSLEKYYRENGEYPSVRSIVNSHSDNTAAAVATRLGVPQSSLFLPNTPSSARTAISTTHNAQNDYLGYSASRPSSIATCQDSLAGGCDSFTITYALESGTVKTIDSRYGN